MVSEHDRNVVKRFKELMLQRGVPVWGVTLFGSRARGDCEPESDYDVLVVVSNVDRAVRDEIDRCAWEAGFDEGLLVVPVILSRAEVEDGPMRSSLLMQAAGAEGVAI